MIVELERRYEMEVAHRLNRGVPEGHMCRRLHGHRYVLEVTISGTLDEDGMLIEYGDLDAIVEPLLKSMVDHNYLNELNERCPGELAARVASNPTVELLICWLGEQLRWIASPRPGQSVSLQALSLQEDSRAAVRWRP